jgi:hypothetical protein
VAPLVERLERDGWRIVIIVGLRVYCERLEAEKAPDS